MTTLVNQADKPELLVIGGLHVDDIAIPIDALQAGVSNPVNWQQRLGGVAANAARVASRATPTELIAALGNDGRATMLVEALQKDNLKLTPVIFPDASTGRYTVILNEEGELHIGLSDVTLAEKLDLDSINPLLGSATPAGVLIDANLQEQLILDITTFFSRHQFTRTIAMPVSPARSTRLLSSAENIDLLICNASEARMLGNTTDDSDRAKGLLHAGFKTFIITDAQNPITVFDSGELHKIPLPKLETIQTAVNGAGDALAGATTAAWLNGESLVSATAHHGIPAAQSVLSGHWQAPAIS